MKEMIRRYPLAIYFGIAFLISWGSGLIVLVQKLIRGETVPTMSALLLFPVLVLGVALTGITLTGIVEGKSGIRNSLARISIWKVSVQWYAVALLMSPILIFITLLLLRTF